MLYNIKIQRSNEYANTLSIENTNDMKGLTALIVVAHHCARRISNLEILMLFKSMGNSAVSLFFFYSGFGLIKSYS